MNEDELERLWNDPKNYKGNFAIYFCKDDPRVIVPKRMKWAGWTINFAHPQAWSMLGSLFLIALGPAAFGAFIWPQTEESIVIGLLLGIMSLVMFCIKMSKG